MKIPSPHELKELFRDRQNRRGYYDFVKMYSPFHDVVAVENRFEP